ncbi:MAG: hypothetical protein ACODAJ_07845 [Planctomycetota bacterium]
MNLPRQFDPKKLAFLERLLGRLQMGHRGMLLRDLRPSHGDDDWEGSTTVGADSPQLVANRQLQQWLREHIDEMRRLRDLPDDDSLPDG